MKCKICKQNLNKVFSNLYDNRHGYPGKFNILKCEYCGFMQTDPQLSTAKLYNIYTKYYPKRDAYVKDILKSSIIIPSKKEILFRGLKTTCHYQTKRGQKVLDIGCGTCQSLLEIKKLGGLAWGIDVDKNSQSVAKKLKLKFHLGTIHNCNFPKRCFDLITASQVIEHVPNPIKFLTDCKQFLTKNGQIILSFPNSNSLGHKVWGKKWLHWHVPYHLSHFNKKSIKLMAKKSNLKIVSIETVTPNLWTILQLRSSLNAVNMGVRDQMWDGGSNSNSNSIKKRASDLLPLLGKFLIFNRLIDNLGFGESFIVKLGA